jgi:hypothetical protein
MVISLAEPTTVLVDDAVMHSSGAGMRCVLNLGAGTRVLSFLDGGGTVLETVSLQVPDGVDIQARFGPGLVITAPLELVATLEAPSFNSQGSMGIRPSTTLGSQSAGDRGDHGAALSMAREVVGSTLEATAPPEDLAVANTVANTVATTVGTALRTAEAGGIGAFRGGGSTGRQGRPLPKDEPTGAVIFLNPMGHPTVVYLDGFVLASWEGGRRAEVQVQLEVGRHMLEIHDLQSHALLHKGELRIDEDFEVQLRLDAGAAPQALNRSWAWQPW